MYRWVALRNPQEPFTWSAIYCGISTTKRTKTAGVTTVKKPINQSGHFEGAGVFNWQPIVESYENMRYPCVSITDCDDVHASNPSKCILDALQFVHVKTGQREWHTTYRMVYNIQKCFED